MALNSFLVYGYSNIPAPFLEKPYSLHGIAFVLLSKIISWAGGVAQGVEHCIASTKP
jgi:hypothetical protein